MPTYRVKNWEKFQHYKDRTPPWIRLHRGLLDDYEFHSLPDASKALAPCLWLLASENPDPSRGEISASDDKIAFRLRMPVKKFQESIKPLIDHGFFEMDHDASNLLAEREQVATPETETEADRVKKRRVRVALEDLSVDHIQTWLSEKRAQGKYLGHDEHFILDYFRNYCISKGKKYEDYLAAYRNAFTWDACQPKLGLGGGNKADRGKAAVMRAAVAGGFAPQQE